MPADDCLQEAAPLVAEDFISLVPVPAPFLDEVVAKPPEPPRLTNEMVLNTEWAQIEAIELVNDGTGLGFGIIGGRSTGVIVKTIVPGGVSDRVS